MEYTFTSDNFEEEVLKSDVPVLVDMFATWCGPCKMMAPVVAQLAEEYEGTVTVSYTHLRAHETRGTLVCRLLLEKN